MKSRDYQTRNFLIVIHYCGPWERLSNLCLGIRSNGTLRREVLEPRGFNRFLWSISAFCDRRDQYWRAKHIIKNKNPHKRWERKALPGESGQ